MVMRYRSLLLRGCWGIRDPERPKLESFDMYVEEGVIREFGRVEADFVLDCEGMLALPALHNAHTHASMTLFRGHLDLVDLNGFLDRAWPAEAKLTDRDIYAGALLAAVEMALGGAASFMDFYMGLEEVARAAREVGLRAVLAWPVVDPEITTQKGDPVENARSFIRSVRGDPLVSGAVAPHSVYACSEETLLAAKEVADEESVPITMHLCETRHEVLDWLKEKGKTPVEWLREIGFLGPNLTAAHLVWLRRRDIALLAEAGVKGVHCPSSNMKLSSGMAPVRELLDAGVTVALGTDGAGSNNSLSMLTEMRTAALLAPLRRLRPSDLRPEEVLRMATVGSARAMGLDRVGKLEEGWRADVLLLDLSAPGMRPLHDPISNLVYAADSRAVKFLFVDGNPVVAHGRVVTVDLDRVISTFDSAYSSWVSRTFGGGDGA